MAAPDNAIFRKAALERLASPERLDARPRLPAYPRRLAAGIALLAVAVIAFAAWLR
ncbi:MAG: hypothetical protein KIS74_02400 [Burkholderiales bacterium]|nr:hypothetical protein [Burkholderiales bacterium]